MPDSLPIRHTRGLRADDLVRTSSESRSLAQSIISTAAMRGRLLEEALSPALSEERDEAGDEAARTAGKAIASPARRWARAGRTATRSPSTHGTPAPLPTAAPPGTMAAEGDDGPAGRVIRGRRRPLAGGAGAPAPSRSHGAGGLRAVQDVRNRRIAGDVAWAGASATAGEAGGVVGRAALAEKAKLLLATASSTLLEAAAPILLPVIGLLVVVAVLASAVGGASSSPASAGVGSLTGVEAEVARSLQGYGFSNQAIAAVLGNLRAESGMDPASDVVMDGQFNYAYERACGLFQYTSTSPGTGEYWAFRNWAAANGKAWSDVATQMEWTFSRGGGGYYGARWGTALAASGYYSNCPGYAGSGYDTADEFRTDGDVTRATYSWMACYERPANGQFAHLDRRIEYARGYLSMLSTRAGGTADGQTSPRQQAILSACGSTPSPGAGWCAAWVSAVYRNAGLGTWPGNACDMYERWCTSSDPADLRPGMIIAVSSHSHTAAGRAYGHVGIYIGNGQVMQNVGAITTQSLDSWIAYYGTTVTPRWGWLGGTDLSQ